MSDKQCCKTCRWWTGDDFPSKHGACIRITNSAALPSDTFARLYPINAGVWLFTSELFGCQLHELREKGPKP